MQKYMKWGALMRDWDHNGRIDARDRYIFHETILREDKSGSGSDYGGRSVRRHSGTKKSEPKKKEEMSGYEIFFWMVFGVLALVGFFVG